MWPWCTTIYLFAVVVAAFVHSPSAHCARDWTFGTLGLLGALTAPALDCVAVARRRRDVGLGMAIAGVSVAVALAALWLVIMLWCGAAGAFD